MDLSRIKRITKNDIIKAGWAVLIIVILVIPYTSSVFVEEKHWIGFLAVALGIFISGTGYYCLISVLPIKAKERDSSISMIALRASSWLVIAGIIIILLGFLYLMHMIPPPGW